MHAELSPLMTSPAVSQIYSTAAEPSAAALHVAPVGAVPEQAAHALPSPFTIYPCVSHTQETVFVPESAVHVAPVGLEPAHSKHAPAPLSTPALQVDSHAVLSDFTNFEFPHTPHLASAPS